MENFKLKNHKLMKLIYIYVFFFIFNLISCQDNKSSMQKKNKNNTMIEKFDFNLYKKFQESDGMLQLENGNTILSMSPPAPNEIGMQTELLPKPSFLYYYKEFYPNGIIKKKELKLSESVKVGVSINYAKDGSVEETVDEDEKYKKIKYQEVLDFLDAKGFINLKNGNGRLNEDGSNKYDIDYVPNIPEWNIHIMQGKKLTEKELLEIMQNSSGEPSPWKPSIFKINGETGKVVEVQ